MNAMVNITQGYVSHFPTAKCQLCPNTYYFHMMFDANQVASSGRICKSCWNAYKEKSRKVQLVKAAKKRTQQMELAA